MRMSESGNDRQPEPEDTTPVERSDGPDGSRGSASTDLEGSGGIDESDGADEPAGSDRADGSGPGRAALRARIDYLEAENEQLRQQYARAKQSQYRRTAIWLAVLGVLALVGAVLFPAVRTVLIAVGSTGVFAAVLTYYLTPERFVAASVGERVYRAFADTFVAVVAELGLAEERVYVPRGEGDVSVRLFVPQRAAYTVPAGDALEDVFVIPDGDGERGIALRPTGEGLYEEFSQAVTGSPAAELPLLADQLTDALVEQFELVEAASADVAEGRMTVGVDGSSFGDVDRFDHPVVSFPAVAVARARSEPVVATVTDGDERFESLIALSWSADTEPAETSETETATEDEPETESGTDVEPESEAQAESEADASDGAAADTGAGSGDVN